MTKTISVNLGGLLFHIDDEAFEILKSYLQAIEKQFSDEREKKEIMQDIEARLAELFNERMDRQKDLIRMNDVNSVISIMGEPHDFIQDDEDQSHDQRQYNKRVKPSKRMYRNSESRVLGGVCSGLGAYFNIDPWIFRVLFIVFSVFFLSGIVIYIILWIAIPEAITSAQKLEMRGEPITIENIKNTVKSEFDNLKERMNL
jgi:phage shock protein PspC (stress-responsive transcriptional regulator)